MTTSLVRQIENLKQMTARQLRQKYVEIFGEQSRSNHRDFLWRRIAWRLQEIEYGGLSQRAKKQAEKLADEKEIRITPPKDAFEKRTYNNNDIGCSNTPHKNTDRRLPPPGTILTRNFRGKTIAVKILEKGFEFENREYRSLSAVAKAATGTCWNGFLFFGLTKRKCSDD